MALSTDYSLLVIVPARAGSKGIPNKNIKILGGIPLIEWTFRVITQAKLAKRTIISSNLIQAIDIARNYGIRAPFIRPEDLSGDSVTMNQVIRHSLENEMLLGNKYTHFMILQPTCPFRSEQDLLKSIEISKYHPKATIISVCEATRYGDSFMYKSIDKTMDLRLASKLNNRNNGTLRQNLSTEWWRNGSIYIVNVDLFMKNHSMYDDEIYGYEMPWDRSVNIDEDYDWKMAEEFARNHSRK